VFFRQQRVGLNGATFDVVKFRTMVHGDNPIIPDANHITRVGVWLRRLSIDELPQLINVARGEMSFVGPRPTLQYQVDRYTDEQRGRLAVKPGLTGWAQVNGRNAIDWDERIALDLEYVRRQSPLFDLKIIVRTFTTLISGDGVEGHSTHDRVSRSEP
jgi:lipopolysaccharide/colanic/teichoic acid biosynthesis glycosyltransferase